MTKPFVIHEDWLKQYCKKKGWNYDKLIQNEQFLLQYNIYSLESRRTSDNLLLKILQREYEKIKND